MKLVIEMNLDNAAFHYADKEEGDLCISEVNRILVDVVYKLAIGRKEGNLIEYNGNKCGEFRLED